MIIGGESVDAADGQTFDVVNPADGRGDRDRAARRQEDVDRAVAAAQAAFDDRKGWANWAAGKRGRTPGQARRPDQAAHARSWPSSRAATSASRSAAPAARSSAASLVFDYYAGAANKVFGQTIPVSQARARPDPARADRRRRADRALELPAADGLLEGGAGARRRQHRHPQARQLLAADRDPARRAGARGRHPGRRPQRRHRARAGRPARRSPRIPGVGKVAFTGETTTGQEIMRLAVGQREEDLPRARRQEPEHRLRRRRPREVRRASRRTRVFDNAGQDCCARSRILVERSVHEQVVELFAEATRNVKVGDPADDATEMGTPRQLRSSATGCGTTSRSAWPRAPTLVVGGDAPDDPALADGAYLMPTVFDGVDQRHADRARGDLRAGRVDHPVRHGGGGAAPRQRHAVRAVRLDLEPRHRQGAAGGQGRPGRASSASTRTARSTPRRRSAATRCRASGASSGCPRWTSTPRRRTSSST